MLNKLVRGINDVIGAEYRIRVLNALSVYDWPEAAIAMVQADGGNTAFNVFYPETAHRPMMWWVNCDGTLLVFIGGSPNAQVANYVWNGYTGPGGFAGLLPLADGNAAFADYVNMLAPLLVAALPCERMFFVGYSLGGAIARWMVSHDGLGWPSLANRYAIGFGSPKTDYVGLPPGGIRNNVCQWVLIDDPVPTVPPRISNWQRFAAGFSTSQWNRMNGFWNPGSKQVIGLDSRIVPGDQVNPLSYPTTDAIGAWMAQADAGLLTSHSLQTYQSRLTSAISIYPPEDSDFGGSGGDGETSPVQGRVIDRMTADAVQTVFADARRQNAQPVAIPDDRLFHAVRGGKLWFVEFGGVRIATAPYKRRARGLARTGNDFIRRLQNEAVVNADQLAVMFVQYLEAARVPGSGFIPPLNLAP